MTSSSALIQVFLTELFAAYDVSGLEYCVLRNFETLPERLASRDVDVLISAKERRRNGVILRKVIDKLGCVLYGHFTDERFEQWFVCKRVSSDDLFVLQLDF